MLMNLIREMTLILPKAISKKGISNVKEDTTVKDTSPVTNSDRAAISPVINNATNNLKPKANKRPKAKVQI